MGEDPAPLHLGRSVEEDGAVGVAILDGFGSLHDEAAVIDPGIDALGFEGAVDVLCPLGAPGLKQLSVIPGSYLLAEAAVLGELAHGRLRVGVRVVGALAVEGEVDDHTQVHELLLDEPPNELAACFAR